MRLSRAAWPQHRTTVGSTLPVTLVTGFLGSGKTTFIKTLLADRAASRVAVVVNELADIGLDGSSLDGMADSVVELQGGCVCCASRGDLGRALARLARHADTLDAVIVELSGVSDPLGAADVLVDGAFAADLRLSQVVTVVDAENFDANLRDADVAYAQLVSADLFVMGKADLVSPDQAAGLRERLTRFNPRAGVIASGGGQAARTLLGEIAGTRSITARLDRPHAEPGYESFAWETDECLPLESFIAWLEALPATCYRAKALLLRSDGAAEIHRVGSRLTVLPDERGSSAQTKVVVVGRDLDHDEMRAGLMGLRRNVEVAPC